MYVEVGGSEIIRLSGGRGGRGGYGGDGGNNDSNRNFSSSNVRFGTGGAGINNTTGYAEGGNANNGGPGGDGAWSYHPLELYDHIGRDGRRGQGGFLGEELPETLYDTIGQNTVITVTIGDGGEGGHRGRGGNPVLFTDVANNAVITTGSYGAHGSKGSDGAAGWIRM